MYVFVLVFVTASWAWNAAMQAEIAALPETPTLDFGQGRLFNASFAVYIFFRFFYEALQTYIYWLMAEIKGAQGDGDIARTTGILRSWESIGSTIAYAVGTTHWGNTNEMILGFSLWSITVPFTLLAVFGDWNVPATSAEETADSERTLETQTVTLGFEGKV